MGVETQLPGEMRLDIILSVQWMDRCQVERFVLASESLDLPTSLGLSTITGDRPFPSGKYLERHSQRDCWHCQRGTSNREGWHR